MFKHVFSQIALKRKAQVAIMTLFIAAVALVFYAVTINIGRMSQIKTVVTTASNLAAAQLASHAASYAEQLWKTQLGGRSSFKKCGLTGAFAALVGVILTIVGAILSPFTAGASVALCVIGIVMATASFVIEAAVIQPAITNAWNKQLWDIMDSDDVYVEQALQTALQNAATDPVEIRDDTDLDGDRRFTGSAFGGGKDKVARFAYLYQKRIHDMAPGGHLAALSYINSLEEFLFDGTDGWGLTDKPGTHCQADVKDSFVIDGPEVPSQCNPCCVPEQADGYDLRPKECGKPPYPFSYDTCGAATPYPGFPDVFDRAYEDPWNDYRSFREQIGRDDEHGGFNRRFLQAVVDDDCDDPATIDKLGHPDEIPQDSFGMKTGGIPFYFGDVDGYYPPVAGKEDIRTSVFPFFWQMKHFGVDLNDLNKTDYKYPECVWCDPADPENEFTDADGSIDSDCDGDKTNDKDNGTKCSPCYRDMVVVNKIDGAKIRVNQLSLGPMLGIEYPDVAPGYVTDVLYETNYYVDGTKDNTSGNPPLAPDNVNELVATYKKIISDDPIKSNNIWLEGDPRYCSNDWPYEVECYYLQGDMDKMDWIVYGLDEFVAWAFELVYNKDFAATQLSKPDWQNQVYAHHALLGNISTNIGYVLDALRDWKNQTYVTDQAWCVPANHGNAPPDEVATFGEGKLEDIIACLAWNTQEDVGMTDSNGNNVSGNEGRFMKCLTECSEDACSDLPRSLVPDFNPNEGFEDGDSCNPEDNPWAADVFQSMVEAHQQGIKMKMRLEFLKSLKERRDDLIVVLEQGKAKIDGFAAPTFSTPPTERNVIYGWKDPDNLQMETEGLWHFVKVEADIPSRIAWINTYTEGIFNLRRCYEMANDSGNVWVNVTRFDQPYSDEGKLKIPFANGKTLWKFWTYNPANKDAVKALNLTGIDHTCQLSGDAAKYYDGSFVEGAFITQSGASTCSGIAENALDLGVSYKTCATYGRQSNGQAVTGYSFKFTGCN